MLPPIPCWPDGAAVTFKYGDQSVLYHKDPSTGEITPVDQIPRENLVSLTLWSQSHPILEVSLANDQRFIFARIENDRGQARCYLIGWQQSVDGVNLQSIAYYFPPGVMTPGRIALFGRRDKWIIDNLEHEFMSYVTPLPCWPDTATTTFHYQDGKIRPRIDPETGTETAGDRMPREGLRKIVLWHHDIPVIESNYLPGQRAIFRRINQYTGKAALDIHGQPIASPGLLECQNSWFSQFKAQQTGDFYAYYLLGWQTTIGGKNLQSIAYYYPNRGQMPPQVVLSGRFHQHGDTTTVQMTPGDMVEIT